MAPQRFRLLDPTRRLNFGWLLLLPVICFLTITASAQKQASMAVASGGKKLTKPLQGEQCPNQGGIVTAFSVPVTQTGGAPLQVEIVIDYPAPPGGYYFKVFAEDPKIAAVGDPQQGLLPQVYIPAGQMTSNIFLIYGNKVGKTIVDVVPQTQDLLPFKVPGTAWDINPGAAPADLKWLDANYPDEDCRDPGSPDLSSDPNKLITCGHPAHGTVTDGVSKLLMRLLAGLSGTGCFQITSQGPPDQGMIEKQVVDTQSVQGYEAAFSFYQAPTNGYGNDGSVHRTVQVQFAFTPSDGFANTSFLTKNMTVVRPPLLLIHGIWSDQKAWPDLWVRQPADSYFVYKADYKGTHDASFSTNEPLLHTAMNQGFVDLALQQARAKSYAATQVDAVTHSMGGLLTRLYIDSQEFMRPDNFNMGDIHRLVTLDTPHGGASFANLVVSLHNTRADKTESTVHDLVGANAFVVNGAVCDLSENSGGLQPLSGGTSILSQVVTASAGTLGTYWDGVNFGPFHRLHSFEKALTKTECVKRGDISQGFKCLLEQPIFSKVIVDGFRFRLANDTIVAQSSQQGGLIGTDYNYLIHFGADVFGGMIHVAGVTNTQAVATQVFQLLDGPDSGFASFLPGIPADGSGMPITVPGYDQDKVDFATQCRPGGPMKQNLLVHKGPPTALQLPKGGDSRVQVTSPANGQVFAPGDTVNIVVTITPPLMATDIAVDVPWIDNLAGSNYDGSTYQASFIIPDDFAGALTLTPDITDANNNPITGVGITIIVRPTSPPSSLVLGQNFYTLPTVGSTARITVTGKYPNNFALDLTSSASGTTYKSSNNQVLTVDTEGNVQAKAFGTAVVTVQNSGLKAFASFDVEDPGNPLAPQDLTAGLTITRSGYRIDRTTGFYVQTIEFANSQPVPVIGPLYFAVTGLASGVTLVDAGSTQNFPPAGSPYFNLDPADGITLQPGERLDLTLQFEDGNRLPINYTPKVFRALTTP